MRALAIIAALLPMLAWGAEQDPASLYPMPEIRFEKRAFSTETSLTHTVGGKFGYSLAVSSTPEGRTELAGGPIVRPLKGLEVGLERSWEQATTPRNEPSSISDAPAIGTEAVYRGADTRLKPTPVKLASTGPLKAELQGNRLRVKYYIDEKTVVSVRARYNRVDQSAGVWMWLERRY